MSDVDYDIDSMKSELEEIMWENAGIFRTEESLLRGLDLIYRLKAKFDRNTKCLNKSEYEFRNMLTVSQLIIKSALKRCESRGAHCRLDYPETIETGIHNCIIKGQGEPSFVK